MKYYNTGMVLWTYGLTATGLRGDNRQDCENPS